MHLVGVIASFRYTLLHMYYRHMKWQVATKQCCPIRDLIR